MPDIAGAKDVVDWFGYWPTFHDAEVMLITLSRSGESQVVIYTWDRSNEVDARGYYIQSKHAVVTFSFAGFPTDAKGITQTRIDYFNQQNVLSYADVEKSPDGYRLVLNGIFGVDGEISCERLSVTVGPTKLDDSGLDTVT